MDRRDALSLNEWAVLACLAEKARHGYDIAAELAPDTELGTVWRVPRQLVYRALERLAALGLVEPRRQEPGEGGPPRQVYGPTRRGRERLTRWLHEPVEHLRDVRGELLLKLVVAHRLRVDAAPLVEAQRPRWRCRHPATIPSRCGGTTRRQPWLRSSTATRRSPRSPTPGRR
jgi:DNA-binding PadR family transcriptional regulator